MSVSAKIALAGDGRIEDAKVRRLFGTDGVRGRANTEPMTAETALRLAMAAAAEFTRGSHRHLVVIGKDTRLSCYMLEPALTAGLVAMGMDVALTGPIPTPAVAMLTRSMRADLGIMISASHNPFEDNGIKLFAPDGHKLSDDVEARIEAGMAGARNRLPPPGKLGRAKRLADASGRYIEFVKAQLPQRLHLNGLRIVADCANGAAYKVAPIILHELGAEVIPVAVSPDGINVNHACGATAPEALSEAVRTYRADVGIALDGDADRVIMCDERGTVIDGDQILAFIASDWHATGRLRGGGVVATVMSNLGLERYLTGLGLTLFRSKVGDRYVVEEMRSRGCNLGGEQSGHLILGDDTTTGDGIASALHVLAAMIRRDQHASDVTQIFEPLPQRTRSVPVNDSTILEADAVQAAILAANGRLNGKGRILIRRSGTEPVVRVMAEAESADLVDCIVAELCEVLVRADMPVLIAAE
jgi:phosphoglucosamine mutase